MTAPNSIHKPLVIALDFDETYNKNPDMFDVIINVLKANNSTVIMATYRHAIEDYDPLFDRLKAKHVISIFTDGKAKKPFLKNLGIDVDIWIDDNPKSVLEDSAWKDDSPELHAWREANKLRLIS